MRRPGRTWAGAAEAPGKYSVSAPWPVGDRTQRFPAAIALHHDIMVALGTVDDEELSGVIAGVLVVPCAPTPALTSPIYEIIDYEAPFSP